MKEFTRVGVRAEMDMAVSIKKNSISNNHISKDIYLVSLRFMGFLDDVYKWNLLSYLKLFLGKPLYIATTHNGEFRPSTTITISGETKKRTEVIALPQLEGYKDPLRK